MYVELYGTNTQEQNNMPSEVYLELRHLSASYFRGEEITGEERTGTIKEFRQPLAKTRVFEFNRFAITNTERCNEAAQAGTRK